MFFQNFFSKILSKFKGYDNHEFFASLLNDNKAVFTDFGDNIYYSDIVNNCIDKIATEISKINVLSVVQKGSQIDVMNDSITRLFRFQPNNLQTRKDFLASCVWLLRKDMNCFIFPQYTVDDAGNKNYTAIYPLNPSSVELGRDNNGVWLIKFYWADGTCNVMPYELIIHMKWRRGKNLIIGGGDDHGGVDSQDVLKAVKALDKLIQGLPLSIENSLKLNGIFKANSLLDIDAINALRDNFEKRIITSKTGIVATDIAGDFIPLPQRYVRVSNEAMGFLKEVVQQRYGVSPAILSGDFNANQHAAFYQTCLEDFIEEFQQAFSAKLFTQREQDVGHRVKCYYNKVDYYSVENKIELAKIAHDTGIMTLNQINDMFGIEPFDNGDRRLQSLNYVNIDLIDKYQKDNKNSQPGGDK